METKKNQIEVTKAGDSCTQCGTRVIKFKTSEIGLGRKTFYNDYYLFCPKPDCAIVYREPKSKKFGQKTQIRWGHPPKNKMVEKENTHHPKIR